MKLRSSLFLVVMLSLMPYFSGCALFLIGAGAAGGYAVIGEDEVESNHDLSFQRVWDASRRTVMEKGVIISENKATGYIEAKIEDSDVKVNIEQVTQKSVRLRIKARRGKGVFPHIEQAQNLHVIIMQKLD